jgi:hypothetical protein
MANQSNKQNPAQEAEASELSRLREENARLREELAEARANEKAQPNTRPVPHEPSFGLTEGERADLEMTGTATSPFTGERKTVEKVQPHRTDEK